MLGTATDAHVLNGKTFTNAYGIGIKGTMPNNGAWINTPTDKGKVTIPAGFHDGNGYVDTTVIYNSGYNSAATAATPKVLSSNKNNGNYDYSYKTTEQITNGIIIVTKFYYNASINGVFPSEPIIDTPQISLSSGTATLIIDEEQKKSGGDASILATNEKLKLFAYTLKNVPAGTTISINYGSSQHHITYIMKTS